MLVNAAILLIKTIFTLIISVLLVRFYLYMIHASYKHPLTQVSIKLTDFIVAPLKKIIPSTKNYENITLILAIIFALLSIIATALVMRMPYNYGSPKTWLMVSFVAILELVRYSIDLLIIAVILQSILSWMQPYNLSNQLLKRFTKPFLQPFSWLKIKNIDLSPILLFIILQFIAYVLVVSIEGYFLAQIPMLM